MSNLKFQFVYCLKRLFMVLNQPLVVLYVMWLIGYNDLSSTLALLISPIRIFDTCVQWRVLGSVFWCSDIC